MKKSGHFPFILRPISSSILWDLLILLLFFSFNLISCSRLVNHSEHIKGVDDYYQDGKFANSLDTLRKLNKKSGEKNQLLFLLEAGSILHTMEEWEKSSEVFEEANEIAERLSKSMGEAFLAFFINEKKKTYIGERFEHVKIKLYLALNNLMLGKKDVAFRYLRALNQDLSDIRSTGKNYQQNFAARYLGALVAEELGEENYARVQYNNLLVDSPFTKLAGQELYRLALLNNDQQDLTKYSNFQKELYSYDRNLTPIPITERTRLNDLGSVVFIHEAGIAPYKTSRGKIKKDDYFQNVFKTALAVAIASDGHYAVDLSILLFFVGESNNPIPQYVTRTKKNLLSVPTFTLGQEPSLQFILPILDNFEETVFRNFNDEYPTYVEKNVANIATRVLVVYAAQKIVEESNKKEGWASLLSNMITVFGGAAISALLEPDLRSWNLTYNNLQMKRIFLEPGEYPLNISNPDSQASYNYLSKLPPSVKIEKGKTTYILLKSF